MLRETSDFRVAIATTLDVWRSAITEPGALSVMIYGEMLMPEWHACNWDC